MTWSTAPATQGTQVQTGRPKKHGEIFCPWRGGKAPTSPSTTRMMRKIKAAKTCPMSGLRKKQNIPKKKRETVRTTPAAPTRFVWGRTHHEKKKKTTGPESRCLLGPRKAMQSEGALKAEGNVSLLPDSTGVTGRSRQIRIPLKYLTNGGTAAHTKPGPGSTGLMQTRAQRTHMSQDWRGGQVT